MKFKQFMTESYKPNLRLEHLEDQVFNAGVEGAKQSILFLRALRDMLDGRSKTSVMLTTKFDGSPAIFAGINPENKRFFVGTKSIFNIEGKFNYTEEDIDRNHGDNDYLKRVLKLALTYLPQLGITGVWQGDVMFTRNSLGRATIDGEEMLTFQPNTIVYAVPADSTLARSMQRAHLGVVWHTQYSGDKMSDMKPSFRVNLAQLNVTPDVWYRDAQFIDASGTATFTEQETETINAVLNTLAIAYESLDARVLNYIAQNDTIRNQIKQFINHSVRNNVLFTPQNAAQFLNHHIDWVMNRVNASIVDAKLAKTKQKRQYEKTELVSFYRGNFIALAKIFEFVGYIIQAKTFIINKLSQVKGMGTFIRTDDGFKVTAPEGFVAVDTLGNAVKLVDRLEFSRANFNITRNWDE